MTKFASNVCVCELFTWRDLYWLRVALHAGRFRKFLERSRSQQSGNERPDPRTTLSGLFGYAHGSSRYLLSRQSRFDFHCIWLWSDFNFIRQVNGVKLADILFSLLFVCLSVCVSVCTQSSLQQCVSLSPCNPSPSLNLWRIYALSERLLVLSV